MGNIFDEELSPEIMEEIQDVPQILWNKEDLVEDFIKIPEFKIFD